VFGGVVVLLCFYRPLRPMLPMYVQGRLKAEGAADDVNGRHDAFWQHLR